MIQYVVMLYRRRELTQKNFEAAWLGEHRAIALDLPSLGAEWYISNAHKWLYAPRGSALLWSAASAPAQPLPGVTSHQI